MTNHFLRQVAAFHAAFQYRQPEPVAPDLDDKPTNELRPRLLREELHKLVAAVTKNDRVGILDALCDTQYVLSCAVLAWGFRPMFENHRHIIELRKLRDERAHLAMMLGLVDQLESTVTNGFAMQAFTHLVALQDALLRAVYHYGFSPVFKDAFDAVHENNCDKYWSQKEMDSCELSGVEFQPVAGNGYICWRGDSKIVKPPHHAKVNLERFV